MAEFTPMMKQYFAIKEKVRDYILFYRLGDFYEMFFEDAITVSRELELTLTGRDCGQAERAPMCGVPYHASEVYIGRLVRKGYKVAICEQIEDPKAAKGIVQRDIVRMVTPGTIIEASMLDETRNNFLCCLYMSGNAAGICYADISTGEIFATATASTVELFAALGYILPHELLLGGDAVHDTLLHSFLTERLDCIYAPLPEEVFVPENASTRIQDCFGELNWQEIGLDRSILAVQAIGGLLQHLYDTQKPSLNGFNTLQFYQQGQYMELDLNARRNLELNARRNLELCETMRTKEKRGSLLWVMDKTKTAMGSRLMRQWIEKPLVNPIHIRKRQEAIQSLCQDILVRSALADEIKGLFDLERLIGRVVYGTANARDLRSLLMTLEKLPAIYCDSQNLDAPLLAELHSRIDLLEDCRELLEQAIVEEPPATLREGGLIKKGYHTEVDELQELAHGGKGKIAQIEAREREATGIKTLKIGYNRVFGYYIEVTKLNSHLVPEHYIRKQTLANAERFITEELKQLESMVLGAQERLIALEYELFTQVREQVGAQVHRIQRTAHALANLDVLIALAELAEENHYVCPEVDFSGVINIRDGRHPVVEKVLRDCFFVPNDTVLDGGENRISIITGPNMAGKSTYMRQVALITLMAQIGSFVPAKSAHIGIVDRVFTRVGASDDLASGQSTFMVEMTEVADILRGATKNSLVILDEIGRGTSTYDGMAIARSVIEYIGEPKKLGCRTLFATHYHELTELESLLNGVKNYNIAVKKRGDTITFLRKIVRGGADDSYGVEVAKLAGIPQPVIARAKEILIELENGDKVSSRSCQPIPVEEPQLSMVDLSAQELQERLRNAQLETLTPIEALNLLFELKKLV